MIKNNILATIFQLIVSAFTLGFVLWIYHMNLEEIFYGQELYRYIFIFVICCIYFLMGKLLKKHLHPIKIIGSFILPIGLGLLLALTAHLFIQEEVLISDVGSHLSLLPLDLYLLPQRMIFTLLNQPQNKMYLLAEILLPSLFMFISLIEGNIKLIRRKRKRNSREGDSYV